MQSPPFPLYLVPPRSKYSPQHHVLKHPQLTFLPQCQRPSFTPIQKNTQNYSSIYKVLYIKIQHRMIKSISWRSIPRRLSATAYSFIRSYPPYRRPFLYPQPEDAPCCRDRDPLLGVPNELPKEISCLFCCPFAYVSRCNISTVSCHMLPVSMHLALSNYFKASVTSNPPPVLKSISNLNPIFIERSKAIISKRNWNIRTERVKTAERLTLWHSFGKTSCEAT